MRALPTVLLALALTSGHAQTLYPNLIPNVWHIGATAAAQRLAGDNVVVSSATFGDNGLQLGAFNEGLQALGFDEGIVLTTGNALLAGEFGSGGVGTQQQVTFTATGSDPDLDQLNGTGASVFNEAELDFDFVTTGTSVTFSYVFGSEEYLEWVGSNYNDAFGFFLSGPGISGPFSGGAVNLATIAGAAVSVNTVNPLVNANYFFDNTFVPHLGDPTVEGVNAQLVYDGFTWGLEATYPVQCNQTYHIKLAICNSGDYNLDSGVFIKKGTLTSPYAPPGPLTIQPVPQCEGEPLTLTVGGDPSWTYTWSTGQSGVGLQQITTTASTGTNSYSVSAEYLTGCSLSVASLPGDVVVHSANNTPPLCLGINGTGSYQAYVQAGDQLCFQIPTSDTPNEAVTMVWDGGAPGTFSSSLDVQAVGTYCWVPTIADIGQYSFTVALMDQNACSADTAYCTFDIKVVCDFCPISVFYENRTPNGLPLPALTEAGWRIVAGEDVDPNQTNGPVETGTATVEFRAPEIYLEPGFVSGQNFLAVPDPVTCLEDCNLCCEDWTGFTVDTYDPDEDGVYTLVNVFSPNGDGTNDYWQVLDYDHPFCAYGAQAFELTIFNIWDEPVWYLNEHPFGCCPFESKAPNNPIAHSSIYWDGTVNTGFLNCYGCEVPASTYYYVLQLWGCNGSVSYTGYIGLYRTPMNAPPGVLDAYEEARADLVPEAAAEELNIRDQLATALFPNPAHDRVTVVCSHGITGVEVFDITGRPVYKNQGLTVDRLILPVLDWAVGEYLFRILPTNGQVEYLRFIKN